jgi:hypothetical protein
MERPRIVTGDDAWRAYQCDLLEEIRDLLKASVGSTMIEVKAAGPVEIEKVSKTVEKAKPRGGDSHGKNV